MKSNAIDSSAGNASVEVSGETAVTPKIRSSEEFESELDNAGQGLKTRERLSKEKKISEDRVSEISEYLNKYPDSPEYGELLKEMEDIKSGIKEYESMEKLSDELLDEYFSGEDSIEDEEDDSDEEVEDEEVEDEEVIEDEEVGKFDETMTIIDNEDANLLNSILAKGASDLFGFLKNLKNLVSSLKFWDLANMILDNRLKEFQGLVKGVPVEKPFDLDAVVKETVNEMVGSIYEDLSKTSPNNMDESNGHEEEMLTDEELEMAKKYVGILDDVSYADLKWEFGGFNGADAEAYGVMIGDLEMDKNGLSFEYDLDLSNWGVEDDDDYSQALACMFVLDNDGQWVGGKFDWISTSRETRDFKNISAEYKGWDLSNVPSTTTVAFVIVSADGKRRSNVITAVWER